MMRFFLLSFVFSSLSVHAEWRLYGERDGGQGFYDPNTVKISSKNKVKVLTYVNLSKDYVVYRTRLGEPLELSSKVTQQYDCKSKTYQFLEVSAYSENHLQGNLIRHKKYNHANINHIDDKTPAAKLYKTLCEK